MTNVQGEQTGTKDKKQQQQLNHLKRIESNRIKSNKKKKKKKGN